MGVFYTEIYEENIYLVVSSGRINLICKFAQGPQQKWKKSVGSERKTLCLCPRVSTAAASQYASKGAPDFQRWLFKDIRSPRWKDPQKLQSVHTEALPTSHWILTFSYTLKLCLHDVVPTHFMAGHNGCLQADRLAPVQL